MRVSTDFPTDTTAHAPQDPALIAEQRRRAVRAVATAARDTEDCARLLEALGLKASEGR